MSKIDLNKLPDEIFKENHHRAEADNGGQQRADLVIVLNELLMPEVD